MNPQETAEPCAEPTIHSTRVLNLVLDERSQVHTDTDLDFGSADMLADSRARSSVTLSVSSTWYSAEFLRY